MKLLIVNAITPETRFRITFNTVVDNDGTRVPGSFYATASEIESGVGDNALFNEVVRGAYQDLALNGFRLRSVSGTYCGVKLQLDDFSERVDKPTTKTGN
jgi:hypothetical protein